MQPESEVIHYLDKLWPLFLAVISASTAIFAVIKYRLPAIEKQQKKQTDILQKMGDDINSLVSKTDCNFIHNDCRTTLCNKILEVKNELKERRGEFVELDKPMFRCFNPEMFAICFPECG